ncbi:MAG TPA: DUF881 domain-containing protein [Actinopolymorphaceae bacterium]
MHERAETEADAAPMPPAERRRSGRRWASRLLAATAFGVAGFLGVTSSLSSGGTDLRAERQTDLADLVRSQVQRNQTLVRDREELEDQVDALSKSVATVDTSKTLDEANRLGRLAGLTAVRGPGLTVTLDDAPRSMRDKADDPDALVVHQQDIQAVANALWAGGAEAMTIQGQRIISTTGLRCVGNSVVVQGIPYPPPYKISAIGDVEKMSQALSEAPGVQAYLEDAQRFALTYDLERSERVEMPGFRGSHELKYAQRRD